MSAEGLGNVGKGSWNNYLGDRRQDKQDSGLVAVVENAVLQDSVRMIVTDGDLLNGTTAKSTAFQRCKAKGNMDLAQGFAIQECIGWGLPPL